MGHFSVHCSLSGMPITYQEVVGFKLIKSRFKDDVRNQWVPNGFPVIGQYSNYGGIDGHDIDYSSAAFVNLNIWSNLPNFYDQCLESYGRIRKNYQTCYQEIVSLFKDIKRVINGEDPAIFGFKWIINEEELKVSPILSAKWLLSLNRNKNDILGMLDQSLFFNSPVSYFKEDILNEMGEFQHELIQKIIIGITDNEVDTLCKLVVAYSTSRYSGRNITPANQTYAVQDSDFKLEYKWNRMVGKEMNNIIKAENARYKKERQEELEEEREEKRLAKLKKKTK